MAAGRPSGERGERQRTEPDTAADEQPGAAERLPYAWRAQPVLGNPGGVRPAGVHEVPSAAVHRPSRRPRPASGPPAATPSSTRTKHAPAALRARRGCPV